MASRTAHINENSLVPPPPVPLSSQRATATPHPPPPRRCSKTSRAFAYSLLTTGRPFPDVFLFRGFVFCMGNGLFQGYYLVYCAEYPAEWYTDIQFSPDVFLSILVMGINIHSDYNAPSSGSLEKSSTRSLFMYISGINFLSEITEWISYVLATSSLLSTYICIFSHFLSLGCEPFTTIGSTSRF